MRRALMAGFLVFAALWLAGRVLLAPRIEARVRQAAEAALRSAPDAREWKDVTVTASGREITLGGRVRQADASPAAESLIGRAVPLASKVVSAIRVEPLPPGLVVLGALGRDFRLAGTVSSAMEIEDILAEIRRVHAKPGVHIRNEVVVDGEAVAPARSLHPTLRSIPVPAEDEAGLGWVALARVGEGWRLLPLSPATALETDLPASLRTPPVGRLLAEAVAFHGNASQARTEHERLAALPPPHLLLCARRDEIILRGEVAGAGAKTRCLEKVVAAFRDWRVVDEVRVSAGRNPFTSLDGLLDDLPQWSAGSGPESAAGVAGGTWILLDLAGEEPRAALEEGMEDRLNLPGLLADAAACHTWLRQPPSTQPAMRLPFLTLVAFDDRVYLAGEVADEAARSQIVTGVSAAYPGAHVIQRVGLDPRLAPAPDVLHSLKTLPEPSTAQGGVVGFAIVGQSWVSREIATKSFTQRNFTEERLFPDGFAVDRALAAFVDGFDAFKSRANTATATPKHTSR